MNQIASKRRILLDKANGVTSLLALLSAVAMIPGAIGLFRFLTDATDGIIELENLIGWGDLRLPGGAIREPYATLVLLIAAVGIPLLLLIVLLVRKARFSRGAAPGSGVYWFALLTGAGVVATALGFTAMLFQGSPGGIANIASSPLDLAFAGVGILMVIAAVYAISMIGQARGLHDPELVNGTVAESGEMHLGQTLPADTEPLAIDSDLEQSESVTLIDVPYDRPRIEQTVTMPVSTPKAPAEMDSSDPGEPLIQEEIGDPEEEFRADLAMAEAGPIPDGVAVAGNGSTEVQVPGSAPGREPLRTDPVLTEAGPVPEVAAVPDQSRSEDPSPAALTAEETDAKEQFPQTTRLREEGMPVTGQSHGETATSEKRPATVIKRRFLKFPDDETKVIVLYREYAGSQVVREWAEIRLRSEFPRKNSPAGNARV